MSKKAEKKYKVVNEKGADTEVIEWDSLRELYLQTLEYIKNADVTLGMVKNQFGEILDKHPEIKKKYEGAVSTLKDIAEENNDILRKHGRTNVDENGIESVATYVGTVDKNNNDQTTLYMAIVVAYNGIIEKIGTVAEAIQTTILSDIAVAADAAKEKTPPKVDVAKVIKD